MKYNENGTIDYEEFNSPQNKNTTITNSTCGEKARPEKAQKQRVGVETGSADNVQGCGKEFKIKNYIFMCNERHLCPSCQEKA